MYNDNFYPSTTEDDFNSAAEYSEYDSEPYGSDEWLNSQETTPILPLPEDGSDWSDQENDFGMQDRDASPMQAMPGALCPTGRLPRFLTGPDALFPTDPYGPTGRSLLYPTGPDVPTDRFLRFQTDPGAPFPTDRDGLTDRFLPGPFLPGPLLPDPSLPGLFLPYGPTGPGTGYNPARHRSPPLSCPRQILQCICPRTDSDLREQPPGGIQSELFAVLPHIQCDSRTLPYYSLPGERHAFTSGRYLDELPQNQDYTVALIRSGSNFRLQTSSF